jgi:hypothetical protein
MTLTESQVLILQSSVWFIDDWLKTGSYPTLDNFADFVYAELDGAGLTITKDQLEYCSAILNQKYPDFASESDLNDSLSKRLADKIVSSGSSATLVFTILSLTLFFGYLIHKR